MENDNTLVSVLIEHDDEEVEEIEKKAKVSKFNKADPNKRFNYQLQQLALSLQLYSSSGKENSCQNIPAPTERDTKESAKGRDSYREGKAKPFRIDTHKATPTLQFNRKFRLDHRLTERNWNDHKMVKFSSQASISRSPQERGESSKRTIFTIKPRNELPTTSQTPVFTPLLDSKKMMIHPSPASETRKRFYINPKSIKTRMLDF